MKPLNEKEYQDKPEDYKANDPKMLNKLNDPETGLKARQTAQNDAIATRMAKDTASSFGKSPPKPIPYMPDYKRINQQSISGPVTKANEENTMSLIHDKKTMSVADAVMKIMEAEKMAKKDHDQDGKIESGKDEYLGSRIRAAKMSGKLKEELKGNQHKIDANKNGKVDAHDFKLLRGKKTMKEEEQLDELSKATVKSYVMKKMDKMSDEPVSKNQYGYAKKDVKGMTNAYNRLKNYKPTSEEVELDEAFPTVDDAKKRMNAGKTATGSVTKTKTGLVHSRDYEHNAEDDDTPAKKGRPTGGGAGKSTKKKKLTEMIAAYKERGIDSLYEEPDNATFTKELEDQKAKFDGKKKGGDVAKPSVQAVKVEQYEEDDGPLSEEQLDELSKSTLSQYVKKAHYAGGMADFKHGRIADKRGDSKDKMALSKTSQKREKGINKAVDRLAKEDVQLDERTLTADETSKKEDYVKGMKKSVSGFKERYGDKAKSVMYATATKMAKKD
jgi:hypothetical protein